MSKLEFIGPFHFDDIDPQTGKIKVDKNPLNLDHPNQQGIYIWGFMYLKNEFGLLPVDFRNTLTEFNKDTMKFIPYYVGISKNNIYLERLRHHQDVHNRMKSHSVDAEKYTRLSQDYMTEFFKDDKFPIHVGYTYPKKIIHFIEENNKNNKNNKKITYFNNKEALEKIYEEEKIQIDTRDGKNYPITFQKKEDGSPLDDYLFEIVDSQRMNNFWFCYLLVPKEITMLKNFETFTYYSLKGKTISKTGSFPNENNITVEDKTNTMIFKKINDIIHPTEKFKGY